MSTRRSPSVDRRGVTASTSVADRGGDGPDLEHAGVDPGHVEQAGDQAGQPVGLDVDELVQLVGVLVGQRRWPGPAGSRRPPSWWPAGCAGRGRPLPSGRAAAGRPPPAAPSAAPAPAAGPAPGPGRHGWRRCRSRARSASEAGMPRRARIPTGRPEAVRATVWISSGQPRGRPEADRHARPGVEPGARPPTARRPPRRRSPGGRPRAPAGPPRARRRRCPLRGRWSCSRSSTDRSSTSSSDSSKSRRASTALRWSLSPGGVETGDHPGHQQHDHRVDDQRHPVLRVADGEPVVGRDEAEVVDEEPGDHARPLRPGTRR